MQFLIYGIFYLVIFIFIFLVQYNFFIKKKLKNKNKGEEQKIIEIDYLSTKFNIPKKNLQNKYVGTTICFINSFIISTVSIVVSITPFDYITQLLVGFILLLALIYSMYEIYGMILVKKKGNK